MLRVERSDKIDPNDVTIPERLRPMSEDRVADLVASFERMGQVSPIQVRIVGDDDDVILVAGRHRLEAARRLGWSYVLMNIVEGDDDEFRLWEIAENLHRSELTTLERLEHIAEWIRITDEKVLAQPEPKPQGGRPESGIRSAARSLGVDRNEAQRAAKVDSISPEAKQAARMAGIDGNQSALLKVAAAPKDEQVEVAMALGAARTVQRKVDDDHEAVAAFVSFILDNIPEAAIGELADRLDGGPVKKFVVALRGLM